MYRELDDSLLFGEIFDDLEGAGAAIRRTERESRSGVDSGERYAPCVAFEEPRCLHLQHEMRPVPVRPSLKKPGQPTFIHPEKDAPVQVFVPLARTHVREAPRESFLAYRLVVPDANETVLVVTKLDDLRPPLRLYLTPPLTRNTEQIQDRRCAQQAVTPDVL